MNICGVLVHAEPGRPGLVAKQLDLLDGVEVHQSSDDGRIVITVEDTEQAAALDMLRAVACLDGVIATALVYHHFDNHDPGNGSHDAELRP